MPTTHTNLEQIHTRNTHIHFYYSLGTLVGRIAIGWGGAYFFLAKHSVEGLSSISFLLATLFFPIVFFLSFLSASF